MAKNVIYLSFLEKDNKKQNEISNGLSKLGYLIKNKPDDLDH